VLIILRILPPSGLLGQPEPEFFILGSRLSIIVPKSFFWIFGVKAANKKSYTLKRLDQQYSEVFEP